MLSSSPQEKSKWVDYSSRYQGFRLRSAEFYLFGSFSATLSLLRPRFLSADPSATSYRRNGCCQLLLIPICIFVGIVVSLGPTKKCRSNSYQGFLVRHVNHGKENVIETCPNVACAQGS